jgi:hypothetical protein
LSDSQGGFAKCYELTDIETGKVFAGKIVEKRTLAKYRAKEKVRKEVDDIQMLLIVVSWWCTDVHPEVRVVSG